MKRSSRDPVKVDTVKRTGRSDRLPWWWFLIFFGGLLAGVFGIVIAVISEGEQTIRTRALQGDPSAFDPIAQFSEMQAFAGADAQLVAFDAQYVRMDGTLDLTADYNANVDAEFLRQVARPDNAPPPGVDGSGTGPWSVRISILAFEPGQGRSVTQLGGASNRYIYTNEGMSRDEDEPSIHDDAILKPPRCPFRDLWKVALEQGAPADAVATIRYNENGYDFDISGMGINLNFTPDCQLAE